MWDIRRSEAVHLAAETTTPAKTVTRPSGGAATFLCQVTPTPPGVYYRPGGRCPRFILFHLWWNVIWSLQEGLMRCPFHLFWLVGAVAVSVFAQMPCERLRS